MDLLVSFVPQGISHSESYRILDPVGFRTKLSDSVSG